MLLVLSKSRAVGRETEFELSQNPRWTPQTLNPSWHPGQNL